MQIHRAVIITTLAIALCATGLAAHQAREH
jgi:hypothetical protein